MLAEKAASLLSAGKFLPVLHVWLAISDNSETRIGKLLQPH